ncbi:gamma-glutamyl-gamma-aminobutyrate hydrolase family protein [Psychromonas sp. Urea-02u-13]|uniref:gamma-glutamyl-gamma-aminobutyrate hydrolase family protein n=1 Tax=Psychromonas sp. Urea-02u-13 TaxID=2058326 RepID=UPI000C3299D4|nr:gamma-glutamyl-gamma-aminobutyrate hydrolase family protein [Psychromonas sp. Urea-02u-13]PKG37964.1 peptidase C26 [Psychromonas sp. Urea-02u-13]
MKLIGITQRVDNIVHYSERRDCLDQKWSAFFYELDYIVVPLPNLPKDKALMLLGKLHLDAILLSGGNSLCELNPLATDIAPERDEFENAVVTYALGKKLPIIGVCRGMQFINIFMGGALSPIAEHIATRHPIKSANNRKKFERIVNSYHAWGIKAGELASTLQPLAFDVDGCIESFESTTSKVLGLMWHPEREKEFNEYDIQLIGQFLK